MNSQDLGFDPRIEHWQRNANNNLDEIDSVIVPQLNEMGSWKVDNRETDDFTEQFRRMMQGATLDETSASVDAEVPELEPPFAPIDDNGAEPERNDDDDLADFARHVLGHKRDHVDLVRLLHGTENDQ
jgi:hypothetical protein